MQEFEVRLSREELELLGTENPREVEEILALLISVDLGVMADQVLFPPAPELKTGDF